MYHLRRALQSFLPCMPRHRSPLSLLSPPPPLHARELLVGFCLLGEVFVLSMGDDDSENGQSVFALLFPLSPWEKYHVSRNWIGGGGKGGWEGLFYIKLATFRKWTFQSLLTIDPTSGTVHVVGPNLAAPQRIRCPTQQDV